jgi:Tfp pilus assembly protein PilO
MSVSVYGERIARMEVEVQELKREFQEHKEQTARNFIEVKAQFTEQNKKLDELLALRNKGAGVLWLIGGIVSTGLFGIFSQVFHWFGAR